MIEQEGRFVARRRRGHRADRRWKVDWQAATSAQGTHYNTQARRLRKERSEAPELEFLEAAKSVLPREARPPWIGVRTWSLGERREEQLKR